MDGRIPSLLNVLPPADELQRQRNSAFQEFLLRKWSGLHIAAHRGLSNILSLLIESGADLSYKDEDGASVIEIAIQKHQTLAAITLLAYGHYSQIQLAAISDLVERVYEHPPTDLIEQLFKCYTQLSEVGRELQNQEAVGGFGSHKTLQEIRSLDDTGTGSLAAIAMAKDWLRKCTHNHGLCTFDQTSHYSPTRVLDIGPHQNKGDLKLVQDVTLNEPYVALSHLWGIRGLPVTTIANIEQRLLSIPLEVLSQTIRDAIDVVRCLGYQYLWVDALCIVQDSEVDWLAEASKMSSVYSGAALTIAVADSSDHTQGGYRDRMGLIGEGEWYMFPSVSQVQSAVRPKGLLDTRSWVLQEQLLSPRILYFDNGELYWDCITMSASESCPFSASLLVDDNPDETWALKLIRRALAGGNDQDILRERIAEVWVQVIKNYSARKLTKESDKLVALEGISHSLANVLGDTLVGGMWETGLWYQLTWWMDLSPKTSRQQVPDPTFLAPSWSWLSAPRALYYHNSLRDKDFTVGTGSHTFTELRPMLKIVSASSETSIRGTSITGTLVISGLSFDYRLTANDLKTPFWKRWNKTKIFLNPGRWLLDRVVETPSNVRCVVVAEDDVDKLLVCLCLVPDENHHGQWKRVGICHWDGLVWQVAKFAGAEPEPGTFTIV
ncbi:HET-domain-containing protein [Dothidotthia symphoricarpi CBS 119687]|uniref:HET-domain-containing protein n=1 Tax=Dothidotthia symphoricarpi CBS 119687 TaxID=1392245 RepID=A0A6A6AC80_9PLEO|nr:HET-domain-containing protein [Dothidotthia symphoricarpi CBS 119687]KAF2129390.1 HET-domain-containing protein [Dothidotthia symphoricarpi CBS 119687]